jgi:nucleoside-diphosphate-sugar epimerase
VALWAITGGNGFVGLHLARRMLEGGAQVRVLDLEPIANADLEAVVGDVRDPRAVAALCRGADVVVHAAAALPIRRAPAEIRSVTVDGTASVLSGAAEAGVRRVVFLSSGVVYGVPTAAPVAEDVQLNPFEPYGQAKREAEQVCASFRTRGLETVVLRPSAVVGAERLGIFGILFSWIRAGRNVYTIGPGSNRYQLLDAADLVDAIVLAGVRPATESILNVGAAEVGPVRAELETLIAYAGSSSRVVALRARPARATLAVLSAARLSPLSPWHFRTADHEVVLDIGRACRALGWSPRFSSEEALTRAYDGFLQTSSAARVGGLTHRASWSEGVLGLLRRVS